jgi:ribonuclease Z
MTSTDFRVTLLGTGVPIPSPDRVGPATLVEAGERKFLIDAGRGAAIRLFQLKVPIGRIDVQLLTHYRSDHTSGVPTCGSWAGSSRISARARDPIASSGQPARAS